MAVNLLFSSRTPSLQVDSGLPEQGRLCIAARGTDRAPATLRIRRPSWLDAGRLAVRRDGVPERPCLTDGWLIVPVAGPRCRRDHVPGDALRRHRVGEPTGPIASSGTATRWWPWTRRGSARRCIRAPPS